MAKLIGNGMQRLIIAIRAVIDCDHEIDSNRTSIIEANAKSLPINYIDGQKLKYIIQMTIYVNSFHTWQIFI